jgi:hypothetical protein
MFFVGWRGHRATTLVQVTIPSSHYRVNTLDGDLCRLAEKILPPLIRSFCPPHTDSQESLEVARINS